MGNRYLFVRAGSVACAIPIAHVIETCRPLPTQPLAGVPDHVRGLAIVRGEPVPVVELGRLVGVRVDHPTRFVIVHAGPRRVALLVDAVVDVRALDDATVAALPPAVEPGPRAIGGVGALDRDLLVVLESSRLIDDGVWSAITA